MVIKKTRKPRTVRSRAADVSESDAHLAAIPETAQEVQHAAPTIKSSAGATRISPLTIGLGVVVLAAALIIGIKDYFYPSKPAGTSPTVQAGAAAVPPVASQGMTKELQDLIAKVATHLTVNTNEVPTIATVADANLLRAQNPVFYKDVQNGDRLLIWSNQAVLYSPTDDKILSVLPISLPSKTAPSTVNAAGSASATSTADLSKITFDVRNGSGVPGLAKNLVNMIKAAGFKPSAAKNARATTPYPKTIVIQMSTKDLSSQAQYLKNELGYQILDASAAPAAELPSSADFLIIVGQDAQH